ncbi:FimB/Mfa2 family fimbrial subunit [Phocaeicola vulgatus]
MDFDYNHDFTIEISFNDYIPVSIKINGWEIINESV